LSYSGIMRRRAKRLLYQLSYAGTFSFCEPKRTKKTYVFLLRVVRTRKTYVFLLRVVRTRKTYVFILSTVSGFDKGEV